MQLKSANLVENVFFVAAAVPDELSTSELQHVDNTKHHHKMLK